jgi:hypothetical protein
MRALAKYGPSEAGARANRSMLFRLFPGTRLIFVLLMAAVVAAVPLIMLQVIVSRLATSFRCKNELTLRLLVLG